ncbi:dihydroneopterin aldolase [Collinsella sp. AGMB00827]|uniref:7,8-dihydroneopterin aldolase n=1 Tax=Collinsella ureilytica TaxID=2869515 RepID=A0ABS7MI45_9ACTN|nr:dihydroneopterin aldolase [Collinsella urealyticum]MBY4797014.1 dihydroneopterin aldolase [Collinsella urealyticum]
MSQHQLPERVNSDGRADLARAKESLPINIHPIAPAQTLELSGIDKILIEGLEVFANHGVYPAENELGQKFVVSLTLFADLVAAGKNDDLTQSIDYGEVCSGVDTLLRKHTFKLIEAAAEHVATWILTMYPSVRGVRVKIEKPWAPVGLPLTSCGVEIERIRR